MNDKIHRSRASSQRSTFLSYGRGMGISPFPPQSPPSVLDRSASGAPDPPVKVALDHAPGPGSVPIHHCVAHNFRAHDWIPHGEISFIWLSQHFQAINQPACSSVLSKWPGCCLLALLRSDTSISPEQMVHSSLRLRTSHSQYFTPSRPQPASFLLQKALACRLLLFTKHPVSSLGRHQPVANAPLI
ncbi:hypothetical protein LZ32DRAFT_451184 [Colletotrichum eremochloae]|nr:hypothetical protein LZ32DRAFT_451184 [Colletotrichum eremochloae]